MKKNNVINQDMLNKANQLIYYIYEEIRKFHHNNKYVLFEYDILREQKKDYKFINKYIKQYFKNKRFKIKGGYRIATFMDAFITYYFKIKI